MSMYQPVNRAQFKNASAMMEGDTRNEIIVKLTDKSGAAIDLTGKLVTWTAANERGKLIENRTANIYAAGEVGIKFLESDSFGDGTVYLQFSVEWAVGEIERFPADGNLFMKVSRSHDNVTYTPVNYVTIEQIDAELSAKFDAYAATVQQGAKGDPGTGLVIKGTLNSTAELPAVKVEGDGYIINGDLYVWDGVQWTNAGPIVGPKGDPGPTGAAGPGLEFSWNGYTLGTRQEGDITYIYSQSLRGATGAAGPTGPIGPAGADGLTGPAGADGAAGPAGKNLEYIWNGYQLGVRQQGETVYTYSTSLRGEIGATGPTGPQGIQGLTGNTGPQGIAGPTGPIGPTGPQGPIGETGAALNILGELNSTAELPATGQPGDGYLISGALYTWNGSAWVNAGNIQGPAGAAGPIGETGPAGKNLEFLWNGYTLGVRQQGDTVYIYSQSLRGEVGATGPQGIQGIQGLTGDTGLTGATGKNIEFLWNGTQLGVRQQGDTIYSYVELKGATGDVGPQGIQGIQGNTGLTGDTGPTGPIGPQGIQGVAGKDLEFVWSGTTLGVRQQGGTTYTYSVSLQGPQGIQGIQGIQGNTGLTGDTGPTGPIGPQGPAGADGADATLFIEQRTTDPVSPVPGQVWIRTDL